MLIRDITGTPVPAGRVQQELVAPMLAGVLPAWLTASTGTSSFVAPSAGSPRLTVVTAATIDATAGIETVEFHTANLRAAVWTCEGVTFGANTTGEIEPWFGIYTENAAGIKYYHSAAATTARIAIYQAGGIKGTPNMNLDIWPGGTVPRNFTMILYPLTKWVYLLNDDQVIYARSLGTDLTNGLVRGRLGVTAKTATARTLGVAQAKLTLIHN